VDCFNDTLAKSICNPELSISLKNLHPNPVIPAQVEIHLPNEAHN